MDIGFARGIKVISAFVFSIDNYGRSQEELDVFMRLMSENLENFFEAADRHGACIRVFGQRDLCQNPDLLDD